MRLVVISVVALLAAAPALAAEPLRLSGEDTRVDLGVSDLFAIGPSFSRRSGELRLLPGAAADDPLMVGGFLEYAVDAFSFGGSLGNDAFTSRLEVSAGYAAGDTAVKLRIGTEWGEPMVSSFSPNPVQFGPPGQGRAPSDLDAALTVSHAITPNLYLSGIAAATAGSSTEEPTPRSEGGFLFGASIGLRF